MQKQKTIKIAALATFALGVCLIITSAFYVSSFLALVGSAIIFWEVIILYITPTKHVPVTFLTASNVSNMNNIERLLSEFDYSEKGIYLPPKILKDVESSLVFIPKTPNQALPKSEETIMTTIFYKKQFGLFLTPPVWPYQKSLNKNSVLYSQKPI